MSRVSPTLVYALPAKRIYDYLRHRYDGDVFREASMAAKGYVPPIELVEASEPAKLVFTVPGRDGLLELAVGSWSWGYNIEAITEGQAKVTIWYEWGLGTGILGAGTVKLQAANEVVETAMALDALASADA